MGDERHATTFEELIAATPGWLVGAPARLYKEIAMNLAESEWREAGLIKMGQQLTKPRRSREPCIRFPDDGPSGRESGAGSRPSAQERFSLRHSVKRLSQSAAGMLSRPSPPPEVALSCPVEAHGLGGRKARAQWGDSDHQQLRAERL